MSRAWIFQANPKQYDIDAALQQLDRIWWRAPQYTSELHAGDIAVIWRSGKDAGIIAVGRLASEPQVRAIEAAEQAFVRAPEEIPQDTTRVLISLRPCEFITKERVRELPALQNHPIITAPMGTVFPIEEAQWEELASTLPEAPPTPPPPPGELPAVFGWEQRAKSVHPMPGGYDAYLTSLSQVCDVVEEQRPNSGQLVEWAQRDFGVSANRAALLVSFLRKAGLLVERAGIVGLTDWTRRWRSTEDAHIVIALLHSRVQFIGEMLHAVEVPKTTAEVLAIANGRYSTRWTTQAQVDRRRGWLQSAGLVAVDDSRCLAVTESGRALLARLTLHDPNGASPRPSVPVTRPVPPEVVEPVVPAIPGVERITQEVIGAATASSDPDRFERAVRDAFDFLGFQAEWLGGAGKTDVLLDAPLGHDASYRVIIDCKTSASGSVGDQQIDWVTLQEHKTKHEADYVVLVAPAPSGGRLFERAADQGVTVVSVDELVSLCRQHARAPLGLDQYRKLFSRSGRVDVESVAEEAESWVRLSALAAAVCDVIRGECPQFGPLTARDVRLILARDPGLEDVTEADIAGLLATLASPLLGVLAGDPSTGYIVVVPPAVVALRLATLIERFHSVDESATE